MSLERIMKDHPRSQQYIGQFSDSMDNNFNLIRLLCAWGVLVYHSIPLAERTLAVPDYIYRFLSISTGEFCVLVFFSISGFLIYRSMTRSSLKSYVIARALRLLPALIIALLLTVFVVGPLTTSLTTAEYFSNHGTWSYFSNLNLLSRDTQYSLPGVFENNPYPRAVNGSIWTLPLETRLYVATILFFFAVTALKYLFTKQFQRYHLLALGIIAIAAYFILLDLQRMGNRHVLTMTLFNCAFFIGGMFYAYRDKIPLHFSWSIALLAGIPFLQSTTVYPLYGTLTIVYTVLVLAYLAKGKILAFNKLGDYSYGMYIYAFPVQQCLSHWTDIGFIGMVFWATLTTLLLSVLSWHFLESPMLARKKAIAKLIRNPLRERQAVQP
jgi:peptidoglycan/LPS O-acetylase OafA/YrhL